MYGETIVDKEFFLKQVKEGKPVNVSVKDAKSFGFADIEEMRDFLIKQGNFSCHLSSKSVCYEINPRPSREAFTVNTLKSAKANRVYPSELTPNEVRAVWASLKLPGTLEVWTTTTKNTYFKIELNGV